ncbi:MAG: ion transporter [Microscillaceae bacterium]|jgi:voltage-gated potassium channel|nr:ion transporter [Microscillaceae bacterium]
MSKLTIKHKLYLILEGVNELDESSPHYKFYEKLGKRFDTFMLGLIFLNLMAFVFETVKSLHQTYGTWFEFFEVFSIVIFTFEYIARLWCITETEKYRNPFWGRLRYAFTGVALIDLISFLPFYLPLFYQDFRFIRSFRLFRLFRLFKMWRYSASLRLLIKIILNKKEDLQVIFFTLFLLLVVSASLMYMIESEAQPQNFASIPETMWWAVSALTTVGYGDIYPKTAMGKVLASIISIIGIGIFAVPAGIISAGFMQEMERNNLVNIATRNGEKIVKSFFTSPFKIGNHATTFRALDLTTIKSRLELSEQDIFEAIRHSQHLRVRYKRNTQNERFSNTLVLEHFDFNRLYGSYINRGSRIAIISPMSHAEHAIGHFTAHLAKYLEADYLSNEMYGEEQDLNQEFAFSFTKNESFLNESLPHIPEAFLHFKKDLQNVIQPNEIVFIIKSSTKRTEEFNLHFGGNVGDAGFDIVSPTFADTDRLKAFYQKLALNFHEEDLNYRLAMHKHFDNTLPDTIHQYIWQANEAQVVTLYIHNDLMEWTNDESYYHIIRLLGDTIREFFG